MSRTRRLQEKVTIAIVEDDESLREALADLMDSADYGVIVFSNAEDFLKSDQRRNAACLITDVQMPGMTGSELYQRLIASGEAPPTIFITAYPDPHARNSALQAGAKCYLAKPF